MVAGNLNPADLFTKHLSAAEMWKHLETLKISPEEGRSQAVPQIRAAGESDGMVLYVFRLLLNYLNSMQAVVMLGTIYLLRPFGKLSGRGEVTR